VDGGPAHDIVPALVRAHHSERSLYRLSQRIDHLVPPSVTIVIVRRLLSHKVAISC
jgi:hypothetical protein